MFSAVFGIFSFKRSQCEALYSPESYKPGLWLLLLIVPHALAPIFLPAAGFRFLHQQRSVCELEIKGSIFRGLWGPHGLNYQKLLHVLTPPRTAAWFQYSLQRSQFLWTLSSFMLILWQDKFPDTARVGLWVGFARTWGFGKDVFTIVF